jgi:hypothetical protein
MDGKDVQYIVKGARGDEERWWNFTSKSSVEYDKETWNTLVMR